MFLEDSAHISSQRNRILCIRLDNVIFHPDAQSCLSIIRLDDENFPSGPSFVSRTFELFQLASV
jgi:hypothetical protein